MNFLELPIYNTPVQKKKFVSHVRVGTYFSFPVIGSMHGHSCLEVGNWEVKMNSQTCIRIELRESRFFYI